MKTTRNSSMVSIVIPTYGASDNLDRAIKSCLAQTYSDIEVIIIDDNAPGSKARKVAEDTVKKYTEDERVVYVKHEKNMGGAAARNTGIKRAKGEFVAFLDDDDFFLEKKIERQIKFIVNQDEFSAVGCRFSRYGKIIPLDIKTDYTYELLTERATPATPSLMISKTALEDIGGFDVSYRRHQDYEMLLRYFEKYKIHIIDEELLVLDSAGADNNPNGAAMEALKHKYLDKFSYIVEDYSKLPKRRNFKKQVYAANYSEVVFAYLRGGDIKNAIRVVIAIIRNSGFTGIGRLAVRSEKFISNRVNARLNEGGLSE